MIEPEQWIRTDTPRSIRVLHVAEVVQGGIATYLDELLLWQGRYYGKPAVALLLPEDHIQYLSAATRQAVTLFPYQRSGRNLSSCLRLLTDLRKHIGSFCPQIIHAHSSFAGFITRNIGVVKDIPIVYTPNGWSFDRDDPVFLRKIYALAEKRQAHHTAAIVTCSEYETRAAVTIGIPRECIRIIPHGINTTRLVPERRELSTRKGPLKLLYIGRLDRQKGFDWLLDAFEPLGGDVLHLTVAGSRVLAGQGQDVKRANIHYAGWVAQNDLDAYIDDCDAVIMSSRWEGFPFVALEVMRRGRALFVSRRGALPEMVGEGEAGIVFGLDDPDELRKLLKMTTRTQLEPLGQKARERFIRYFTSEQMNQATHALYCSLGNERA